MNELINKLIVYHQIYKRLNDGWSKYRISELLDINWRTVSQEDQVAALERKKVEQEVKGETYHPGYLGAKDTYYIWTIKGVGRIYQLTFMDTYSKTAHLKLYYRENALVSADILR